MRRARSILVLLAIFTALAGYFLLRSTDSPEVVPTSLPPTARSPESTSDPLAAGTVESPEPVQPQAAQSAPESDLAEKAEEKPAPQSDQDRRWKDDIIHRYSEPRDLSRHVTLKGQVIDIAGRAVRGAEVVVTGTRSLDKYRTRGGPKTLGVSGRDGLFSGVYGLNNTSIVFEVTICARVNELESNPVSLNATPGDEYDNILITMPASCSVSSRVVDSNFQPLNHVHVSLRAKKASPGEQRKITNVFGHTAFTDSDGRFTIANLASGEFALFIFHRGYESVLMDIALPEGMTTQVPDIVLTMNTSLRLTLMHKDKPLKGRFTATFYSDDGSTEIRHAGADIRGRALIDKVPAWAVELEIEMADFERTRRIRFRLIEGRHEDIGNVELERKK